MTEGCNQRKSGVQQSVKRIVAKSIIDLRGCLKSPVIVIARERSDRSNLTPGFHNKRLLRHSVGTPLLAMTLFRHALKANHSLEFERSIKK